MTATKTLTYGTVAPTNPNDGDQWLKPSGYDTVYQYRWNTTLAEWEMHSAGVPPGGTPGQILTKTTAADYDNQWTTPATGTPPDATTSSKGIIQLAGDLAGTAASPQIASGAIVNADINAAAAIAASKLAGYPNDQTTVLRGDGNWLAAPRVTYGTTPPASPADGDQWIYPADATNGVIWQFRYRAASASTYKWEFIGGAELVSQVDGMLTIPGTTYSDIGGPVVTTPRAGDYLIRIGTGMWPATTNSTVYMSISIGGAAAVDTDGVYNTIGATITGPNVSRTIRKNAVGTTTTIRCVYRTTTGTGNAQLSWLTITPVRIS